MSSPIFPRTYLKNSDKTKNAWLKNEQPKTTKINRGHQNQTRSSERPTTNYEMAPARSRRGGTLREMERRGKWTNFDNFRKTYRSGLVSVQLEHACAQYHKQLRSARGRSPVLVRRNHFVSTFQRLDVVSRYDVVANLGQKRFQMRARELQT